MDIKENTVEQMITAILDSMTTNEKINFLNRLESLASHLLKQEFDK